MRRPSHTHIQKTPIIKHTLSYFPLIYRQMYLNTFAHNTVLGGRSKYACGAGSMRQGERPQSERLGLWASVLATGQPISRVGRNLFYYIFGLRAQ